MKCYFGEKISIVPFTKGFYSALNKNNSTSYFKWFSDQKVTKYNDHGLVPMLSSDFESFFNAIENREIICAAIIYVDQDIDGNVDKRIHIGNCSLQGINQINRSCEFSIIIGESDFWNKGYATRAMSVMLYHAFNHLNMHRVWSGTTEPNKGMQKIFEKLGFIKESIFREAKFLGGKYVDIYQYSMLKQEFDDNEKVKEILKEFVV